MSDAFDTAPAAAILAQAWRDGTQMTALPEGTRPSTLSEGYDIQDHLIASLGEEVAGWKLGVGSTLQKRQSGIGRPIAGRVLRSRMYPKDGVVPLPTTAPVTIEFEIAYVLGRDILPEDTAPAAEAIGEVRVSFELVLARYVDRRAVGWPSFAADNAGFHALVLGDVIDPSRIEELRASLVVKLDGQQAALALTGDDISDPLQALQDLADIARERRMVLPKGSVISTGAFAKPFTSTAPSATVSAHYLGQELRLHLQVASPTTPPHA